MGIARRWTGVLVFAALAGAGAPGLAEEVALVIGNGGRGAEAVVDAAATLRRADVAVVSGAAATAAEQRRLLAQVEQMAPSADGLMVVLTGRFVHSEAETYFLPEDSDGAGLVAVGTQAMALSPVLALLARVPGRALLVLSENGRPDQTGPFLRSGPGALDLPQGVTLVQGPPGAVAKLLRGTLAEPGARLAVALRDDGALGGEGYLPGDWTFLGGADPGRLRALQGQLDAAEQRARQAERDARQAEETASAARAALSAAEQALWSDARDADDQAGYRRYLDSFPEGRNAAEARRALEQIRNDPFRDARIAEEALNLTREQRQQIQRDLSVLDFNTRGIDGIFGPGTRSAVRGWQRSRNLPETSYLDADQVRQLGREAARRGRELRQEEEQRRAEIERKDRALWADLGEGRNEAGLRSYLESYPDGLFADEARARLREIERDRQARAGEQERLAWRRTTQQDTSGAYREYLQTYPQGTFVAEARARLRQLEQADNADVRAAEAAEAQLGLSDFTRRAVEQRLDALGLKPGQVDGTFDGDTRRAIRQFQRGCGSACDRLPHGGHGGAAPRGRGAFVPAIGAGAGREGRAGGGILENSVPLFLRKAGAGPRAPVFGVVYFLSLVWPMDRGGRNSLEFRPAFLEKSGQGQGAPVHGMPDRRAGQGKKAARHGDGGLRSSDLPGGSALACLELALGLVDDVDAALAAHHAAVPVAVLQRAERVADFHGPSPLVAALARLLQFPGPSPVANSWWAILGSNQ